MCDLALHNYEEMRASVTKPGYKLKIFIMGWMHYIFPETVIPLYTMVSFTRIPYAEVWRRWKRQTWWLGAVGWGGVGVLGSGVIGGMALIGRCVLRK